MHFHYFRFFVVSLITHEPFWWSLELLLLTSMTAINSILFFFSTFFFTCLMALRKFFSRDQRNLYMVQCSLVYADSLTIGTWLLTWFFFLSFSVKSIISQVLRNLLSIFCFIFCKFFEYLKAMSFQIKFFYEFSFRCLRFFLFDVFMMIASSVYVLLFAWVIVCCIRLLTDPWFQHDWKLFRFFFKNANLSAMIFFMS